MSNEINAMHVASFLRLSARYINGARTSVNFGGEAATEPLVPEGRARAAARPSACGAQGNQGTALAALRLSGGAGMKPSVPLHASARISKSAYATTSMDTSAGR